VLLLVGISKSDDEVMLDKAIAIYVNKYGIKPQICYVNSKTFSDDFKLKSYHGVELIFDKDMKVGDFGMKVE